MENFFGEPRANSATISRSSARRELPASLKGYVDAGLTAIIARVASDDVRSQARMLVNEIRPAPSV
jgi:hypothetical protein